MLVLSKQKGLQPKHRVSVCGSCLIGHTELWLRTNNLTHKRSAPMLELIESKIHIGHLNQNEHASCIREE
jgi:hypothetical protein